jgi:hypothetical protein
MAASMPTAFGRQLIIPGALGRRDNFTKLMLVENFSLTPGFSRV